MMLDVAQKYQRAFERMEVEDRGLRYALLEPAGQRLGAPNAHDWTIVRYFVQFFKIFYDITMRISGSKYTIANLYFSELSELHFHLKNNCAGGLLSALVTRMKTKYDKYWENIEKMNKLLFVTVILNLRYKLVVIEFWVNSVLGRVKASQFIKVLKSDIDDLYSHYSNSGQPSSAAGSSLHLRSTGSTSS